MSSTVSATKPAMSLAQWAALPEDTLGELVDGRLVEEELPDLIHEAIVVWLIYVLKPWVAERGGRLVGSSLRVAVGSDRGRRPDVVVFLRNRPEPRGLVTAVPDIVIEVVSPEPSDQRRDRVDKVGDYARRGIGQYWLVDPQLGSFEVLTLGESGRYEHAVATTSGVVEIPDCPGLRLDLDELWAELAQLEGEH